MGNICTVVVIMVATLLACAAFGLALSPTAPAASCRLRAAPGRHAAARAAGSSQQLGLKLEKLS